MREGGFHAHADIDSKLGRISTSTSTRWAWVRAPTHRLQGSESHTKVDVTRVSRRARFSHVQTATEPGQRSPSQPDSIQILISTLIQVPMNE